MRPGVFTEIEWVTKDDRTNGNQEVCCSVTGIKETRGKVDPVRKSRVD